MWNNCFPDLNVDKEFQAWCLHERRCYSVNDMGILREEELQELAVVIEAVKQPSSVVD